MRSHILGTGSYVPKQVLTNVDLEQLVDTSDAWIVERTGIRERRRAAPGEACSDLGVQAAQQALSAAHIQAADLDLIIVILPFPPLHPLFNIDSVRHVPRLSIFLRPVAGLSMLCRWPMPSCDPGNIAMSWSSALK